MQHTVDVRLAPPWDLQPLSDALLSHNTSLPEIHYNQQLVYTQQHGRSLLCLLECKIIFGWEGQLRWFAVYSIIFFASSLTFSLDWSTYYTYAVRHSLASQYINSSLAHLLNWKIIFAGDDLYTKRKCVENLQTHAPILF